MTYSVRSLAGFVFAVALAACTNQTLPASGNSDVAPSVLALSTYSASVGTLVEVYGENFPTNGDELFLVFDGTFVEESGARETVNAEFPLRVVDAGTARWTSFGPYTMPLARNGSATGVFEGSLSARSRSPNGSTLASRQATPVSFEVRPSLVVHEFQPLTASCADPVTRVLGGVPYRVRVEAIGFQPASFTYSLSFPTIDEEPIVYRHAATGRFDSIGDSRELVFPMVPSNYPTYAAVLSIEARDASGASVQSLFAIEAHRPLEVFYNGNVDIAEILAPAPVSGCIPGGSNGREASYNESTTETRSRSYAVSWNQSWLQSHSVSSSTGTTIGVSENNAVAFGTTNGTSFNWSVGTEVSAGIEIPSAIEVGAKVSMSTGGEVSQSNSTTTSRDQGVNVSTTSTDAEDVTNSTSQGASQDFAWDVSSSNYIGRDFSGTVIAGTYGVFYRQTMRLVRRAALVTYNLCGNAKVVGDVDIEDWAWSPDLALGESCPPLPESNLPRAQCLIPPCLTQ